MLHVHWHRLTQENKAVHNSTMKNKWELCVWSCPGLCLSTFSPADFNMCFLGIIDELWVQQLSVSSVSTSSKLLSIWGILGTPKFAIGVRSDGSLVDCVLSNISMDEKNCGWKFKRNWYLLILKVFQSRYVLITKGKCLKAYIRET